VTRGWCTTQIRIGGGNAFDIASRSLDMDRDLLDGPIRNMAMRPLDQQQGRKRLVCSAGDGLQRLNKLRLVHDDLLAVPSSAHTVTLM
jgi:hypothetical protein